MMRLWFDSQYRLENWSLITQANHLQTLFKRFRFPSTTTRLPRLLTSYSSFKAGEMRVLLLFGHVIFEDVMKRQYYQHLLKLVLMMHLCENRQIHLSHLELIHHLGQTFVVDFVTLYGQRHCVQVVHSVSHIADTVRDFGPLPSFTTFQFENQLGNLKKRNHGVEKGKSFRRNFNTFNKKYQTALHGIDWQSSTSATSVFLH